MFSSIPYLTNHKRMILGFLLAAIYCQTALPQSSTEVMAEQLIALRGNVEDLQAEIQILQSEHSQSMAYLNNRKTELKAQLDRQQLLIKQAEIDLQTTQTDIQSLGADSNHMIPTVVTMLDQLMLVIKTGIPFKHIARQDVLAKIKRNLVAEKITAQQAINQTWAFIEDEIRLSQENGLYSQTIELNGEEVLVEVAKLGTVLMYFKTKQNEFGQSVITDQGTYEFILFNDESQKQAVAKLFDSLQKQIRQGHFELPFSGQLIGVIQ